MATPVIDLTKPLKPDDPFAPKDGQTGIINGALSETMEEQQPVPVEAAQQEVTAPVGIVKSQAASPAPAPPTEAAPVEATEVISDESMPVTIATPEPQPVTTEVVPSGTGVTTPAPIGIPSQGAYPVATMAGQVRGITPQTIQASTYQAAQLGPAAKVTPVGYSGQGYTATLAPEAIGYEAQGYTAEGYSALQGVAKTTAENVSEAIQRITGADSPIMQRAVAQATAEANRRGLLNSSMAAGAAQGAILDRAMQIAQGDIQNEQFNVAQQNQMEAQNIQMGNEALRFSADARNRASEFISNAKNQAAQFLAAEKNQNGRFSAEQANRAAEFSANAANQAAQFNAAAQNQAFIFNAGESNRMAMFSAEQANIAARSAAEMEQAASTFNATAFNQAQQRYADAMNAALAAQVDAENLSRRDLAAFTQQAQQNALDRQNRLDTANISAGASVQAAGISAAASAANAEAQRIFAAGQAELDRSFRSQENEATRAFTREQMGASAYNNFVSSVGSIMTNPNLTDEGRQNAITTLMGLHNGNPYALVNIGSGAK